MRAVSVAKQEVRKIRDRRRLHPYAALLFAELGLILIYPFLIGIGYNDELFRLLAVIVFCTSLYAVAGRGRVTTMAFILGLPAIVVPAGFTRVVYDRVPDASDPNGSRLDGPKPDQVPVAMEFLGRQFDEALLFEIASAYEAGTKHRRPPKGFGSLAGEP